MIRKRVIPLVIGSAMLLPVSGIVQAETAVAPVFSAGAETVAAGGSLMNVGQAVIGRSTGGGITLHAGAIPCYLFSTPVTISNWQSVRAHAGLGNLPIPLSLTATGNGITGPTVETRSGGIQRLEVRFSSPVTLVNTAGVSVSGRTTAGGVLGAPVAYLPSSVAMADASTMAITFAPNALPDETCYTVTIGPGSISNMITLDSDCNIRSLLADTTMSGEVNLSDALLTKVMVGQPVATHPQYDVTLAGGNIVNAHALFVKARVTSPAHRALCP